MKILVTGCAGFIGSHLCEKLLIEGHDVIGLDNLNNSYDTKLKKYNLSMLEPEERFIFIKDDICTTQCILEHKPEKICHLAGISGNTNSLKNSEIYVKNNIMGTINLLNQAVSTNVKLFVYASCGYVYGLNDIPFNENDKLENMNSHYAVTKKSVEDFCKLYHQLYNLSIIGLRIFSVYGPSGNPNSISIKFLKNIINEKEIVIYGDGYTMRDYTYIDDIIDGIILSIENKSNNNCELYNLGNNNPVMIKTIIETCEKIVGKKAIIKNLPKQKGTLNITMADISKAKINLGYNPKIGLEDGLEKTYKWLLIYK